jgi:hypothetical protein
LDQFSHASSSTIDARNRQAWRRSAAFSGGRHRIFLSITRGTATEEGERQKKFETEMASKDRNIGNARRVQCQAIARLPVVTRQRAPGSIRNEASGVGITDDF